MRKGISFSYKNCSSVEIKLILEPWAREYAILPGKAVQIYCIGDVTEAIIEVEYTEGCVSVYGWGAEMSVESDGKVLEPCFE